MASSKDPKQKIVQSLKEQDKGNLIRKKKTKEKMVQFKYYKVGNIQILQALHVQLQGLDFNEEQ